MNTKSLLDQLLKSGTDLLQNNSDNRKASKHDDLLGNLSSALSGKGSAALAGGALGLLLGSKSGRKIGGKVLTYGGLAIIGTLAYKAYQNHQQQSKNGSNELTKPLTELPQNEVEAHSKVILIAIVAAAKSDGHIDQREQQMIDAEVAKMTSDQELKSWLNHELNKALDPAEVARYALNESMASEMYLASLLTIDQHSFMEKTYIEELARQLKIPAALKIELEKQAQEALASATPQT
jgi:uncharacterized membrane protein YebE (DUF533 family)